MSREDADRAPDCSRSSPHAQTGSGNSRYRYSPHTPHLVVGGGRCGTAVRTKFLQRRETPESSAEEGFAHIVFGQAMELRHVADYCVERCDPHVAMRRHGDAMSGAADRSCGCPGLESLGSHSDGQAA